MPKTPNQKLKSTNQKLPGEVMASHFTGQSPVE
jgi:hypothetical protein